MKAPTHHPSDELLLDYADGSLTEAEALIVASHLALCPSCRTAVSGFEAIGGALLEDVAPTTVSSDARAAVLAQLDGAMTGPPAPRRVPASSVQAEDLVLPQPLRSYVGVVAHQIVWNPVMRGLDELDIGLDRSAAPKARLIRIRAGMAVPQHTHRGTEMTLVLSGGFQDDMGHFLRGDFAFHDGSVDHRPIADRDADCLCLTVTSAPVRLTGLVGRFLNPFLQF